jgi:hypothetical protein
LVNVRFSYFICLEYSTLEQFLFINVINIFFKSSVVDSQVCLGFIKILKSLSKTVHV